MHAHKTFEDWGESAASNVTIEVYKHILGKPGEQVLNFWMVDPTVVLQKIDVETGEEQ